MLRGFYALEQTRRVFWIQCAIAATNIVAAVLLSRGASPAQTAPRLVAAYACSYAVGALVSSVLLAREVGGLQGRVLLRFLARLALAVAPSAALAYGLRELAGRLDLGNGTLVAVGELVVVGLAFLAAYVGLARLLRLSEVAEVVGLLTRRLGRGR
jgi:putative peptidoglycan lipid II flippase